MTMNTSSPICSGIDIGVPMPVAMNSEAMVR